MAKNKVYIDSKLKSELREYMKNFASGMARVTADEMQEETKEAIDKFYEDYTPKVYERHFYNLRNNTFNRFYHNPHGTTYRGGIELVNNLDNIYSAPTSVIFGLVIFEGKHGNPINKHINIRPMKPTPRELIERKREYILNNLSEYESYGYGLAESRSYSTFRTV